MKLRGHAPARRSSGAGFTLLELVVVICVVAIVWVKLLQWTSYYQEQAEKAAMETTVASLQSALTFRASALLVRGSGADINALSGRNPMEWMAERPENYLGAFLGEPPIGTASGIWFFKTDEGVLVYRPQRRQHLVPSPDGSYDIKFRVHADYGEVSLGGTAGSIGGLRALRVAPLRRYAWFSGDA